MRAGWVVVVGLNHRCHLLSDLVVRDMLSPEQVAVLNAAVDAHEHEVEWEDNHQYGGGMRGLDPDGKHLGGTKGSCLEWEQPHCQPFRDLLAHPKLIPYMNTFFGRGWKLDHHPFMITGDMHTKQGKETSLDKDNFHGGTAVGTGGGGTMHGSTSRIHNGSQYYTYANGTMRNGMIVAAFQLRTINEGDGGFVSDETLSI